VYAQHLSNEAIEFIADAATTQLGRSRPELDIIDIARAVSRRAFRALDCHEALYRPV
jgi:hypothetical protein